MKSEKFEAGKFYWVMIVLDPDAGNEWENKLMPARFAGYSQDGEEMWNFIDPDTTEWPVRLSIPIALPAADRQPCIQGELVSMYRYKAMPRTVTPGGPIMGVITEVFESVNDNTRIIIETSNGGASLRAEKLSVPVAAGSVDRPKLLDMTLPDTETRDWYFDCDGHYIDVELRKDGYYSIYFRNRADGGKGWLDTGVLRERAEKAEARATQLSYDLLDAHGDRDAYLSRALEAEARVKELQAELDIELERAYDRLLAARTNKQAGRQTLQAEGKHPAPCARDCEANAFQIEVRRLQAESAHKQAIIDRLMLEYCPDEMTAAQMAEWASHQKCAE